MVIFNAYARCECIILGHLLSIMCRYTPVIKTSILSTNVDQKSLETEYLIAISRLVGDKWQSKTLFLAIL